MEGVRYVSYRYGSATIASQHASPKSGRPGIVRTPGGPGVVRGAAAGCEDERRERMRWEEFESSRNLTTI